MLKLVEAVHKNKGVQSSMHGPAIGVPFISMLNTGFKFQFPLVISLILCGIGIRSYITQYTLLTFKF
jgi:hypothetical protein